MSGFMMSYKGIPSTYNKDLQEDKEPMFDAADTLSGSLQITSGVLSTMNVSRATRLDPQNGSLTNRSVDLPREDARCLER